MNHDNQLGANMTDEKLDKPKIALAWARANEMSCEDWARVYGALLSASKPAAPEGWKLVPVELTPEMVKAGSNSGGLGLNFHEWMGRITIAWRHILAASPPANPQSVQTLEGVAQYFDDCGDPEGAAMIRRYAGGQPVQTRALTDDARDAARYRAFFDAGLPITFCGIDYHNKLSLDAAIDAALKAIGSDHE